jgi:N utilization substance protein B
MSTRREAREQVMKALYAHDQADGSPEQILHTLIRNPLASDPPTRDFAEHLFRDTLDTAPEADRIIERHAENWDLHRIAAVDRALLRMATTELLRREEIPPKVSVDEAIEIAKKYSTPRSGTFINGVIDAILLDLHEQGRLSKTGRGRIGMDSLRERARSSGSA